MSVEAVTVGSRSQAEAERERSQPLELLGWVALVGLAPATLVYLSFNAGGYFPSANGLAALVLAQALVLRTVLAKRPFEGFSRALCVPLLALALYGAWQLASVLWSHASARALDAYDRTLLYVLALALFGSVRCTPVRLRWLARAVFAGLLAVCLAGLVSRLLPHLWPTAASFYDSRLSYPLTYWNAEGMLAAIALILGVHLSSRSASSTRACACSPPPSLPALAATLLLTFSRGALGVTSIGLLVYCLLTRPQHAAHRAARRRAAVRARAALGLGRHAAGHQPPHDRAGRRPGPPRGARRGGVRARRRGAAFRAAARSIAASRR